MKNCACGHPAMADEDVCSICAHRIWENPRKPADWRNLRRTYAAMAMQALITADNALSADCVARFAVIHAGALVDELKRAEKTDV